MIKKTLKINGVERILILDKDETLAQVLRNHLLLTGCKIGCGEGHCEPVMYYERKSYKILYLQDEPCSRSCRDHNH